VAAGARVNLTLRSLCATAALLWASAALAVPDDSYLAGYATAVIERDLGLRVVSLEVHDGVARVVVESLGDQPEERISEALTRIEGIARVEVSEAGSDAATTPAPTPAGEAGEPVEPPDAFQLLPRIELFDPLIADPRDPHFSASYVWYLADPELTHAAVATFGETFALFGGDLGFAKWELGWLGGAFSIFDLDSGSYDLLNTDFRAGPTFSMRRKWLSGTLRLYHQSSHLGDEFLLRSEQNRDSRVNLSYEGIDGLVSVDPWPWLRLYAGAGELLHTEPHLQRLSAHGGAELTSPWALFDGAVRPIAAFDYQGREENHWREELAGSAGIQLENPQLSKLKIQITADYFKGNSPNGQFFVRRIETIGIGIHLHF
jgi:hypothetical protein